MARFPIEEGAISLKTAPTSVAMQPLHKKTRSALPSNPVYKPSNQRAYVPPAQAQQPKSGNPKQAKPYKPTGQLSQANAQQAYKKQKA